MVRMALVSTAALAVLAAAACSAPNDGVDTGQSADPSSVQQPHQPYAAAPYHPATVTQACDAGGSGGGGNPGSACAQDSDCAGNLTYCKKAVGDCDGTGVCTVRLINVMCIETERPVCGCNGQTYRNDCYAEQAGASIAHDGACD